MAAPSLTGVDLTAAPSLARFVELIRERWPTHMAFVGRNLAARSNAEIRFLDDMARRILIVSEGRTLAAIDSYRDVCAQYLRAEMEYRKKKRYVNDKFDDVVSSLYDHSDRMNSYMTGLLLSVIFWWQNSGPYYFLKTEFLTMFDEAFALVEVGPGHGLGSSLALELPNCTGITGLDISAESIAMTQACLRRFGHADRFFGKVGDICVDAPVRDADGMVISQVLEIVSDPVSALRNARASLRDGGLLFLNAPVNFAAPDHIRRWGSADEIDAILDRVGFKLVKQKRYAPSSIAGGETQGYSYVAVCSAV
ncbi:MAG: class I SAM-dependent methyltransferase [Rhizobiaceae bacterium]|nr:class I SAM-dependent methyltransferase [Rhizobiaceae bacterium]